MRDWRWNFLFHYLFAILQRSVFDFCIEPVELRNQVLLAQIGADPGRVADHLFNSLCILSLIWRECLDNSWCVL